DLRLGQSHFHSRRTDPSGSARGRTSPRRPPQTSRTRPRTSRGDRVRARRRDPPLVRLAPTAVSLEGRPNLLDRPEDGSRAALELGQLVKVEPGICRVSTGALRVLDVSAGLEEPGDFLQDPLPLRAGPPHSAAATLSNPEPAVAPGLRSPGSSSRPPSPMRRGSGATRGAP